MTTPIDDISQSEASTRLQRAQMQWAQQRVSSMGQVVADIVTPAVTPHDISLARQWREQNSITLGDKLYLLYIDTASQAILSYMKRLWIDTEIIEFARTNLENIEYKSTYTEQNPEFWMEPGPMWNVRVDLGSIRTIPLTISMRHVIEEAVAYWAIEPDSINTTFTAIELQYIIALLHELVHVVSTSLHLIDATPIWRSGLRLFYSDGTEIGDMKYMNEVLTDIIAGEVFWSDEFTDAVPLVRSKKYRAGYRPYYAEFYDHVIALMHREKVNLDTAMTYVRRWYLWDITLVEWVRMSVFDQEELSMEENTVTWIIKEI